MNERPLHLFAAHGIELEYMIVDAETLNVRPITDELFKSVVGEYVSDIENDEIAWSNELVLHVVELKTNGPAAALGGLPEAFQANLRRIGEILAPMGARLMPTAMHPWMNPDVETRLWPHDANVVYATFDRIFDCRGHGWSNLQSVHVNLPFHGDEEFGRLHAAIRLLLPILPALAASSPFVEGRGTGVLDNRLEFYRRNCARIPSVTGAVIPEPVFTRADYERDILERIYHDLAPYDPDGILRDEWANARGTIARFDRSALEIRVLDVQECPRADVAIAACITHVLRALVAELTCSFAEQKRWPVDTLAALFRRCVRDADRTPIDDARYLAVFGVGSTAGIRTVGELWQRLAESFVWNAPDAELWRQPLTVVLERGTLARRILQAAGPAAGRARLHDVYLELCDCLDNGTLFRA